MSEMKRSDVIDYNNWKEASGFNFSTSRRKKGYYFLRGRARSLSFKFMNLLKEVRMRGKRNVFVRKGECWQCAEKFHLLMITKYHGILCKKCYNEAYRRMKKLFHDFMASFEVEYDTDFREETKTLEGVIEMISGYYKGSCYHIERDEPKKEYKEVVNDAKELYLEMKEFDTKSFEGSEDEVNEI